MAKPKHKNISYFNSNYYYSKEERHVTRFTLIIHVLAVIMALVNICFNYSLGFYNSLYAGAVIMISLTIAMLIYFGLKLQVLGSYISVIGSSIGVSMVLYLEGRISFNFLYYFPIILSVPFLVKRNKNFVKHNYILFICIAILACTTMLLSSYNPTYNNVTETVIKQKLFLNTGSSLLAIVIFGIMMAIALSRFFKTLIKDKKTAEIEKNKRLSTLYSLSHELRTQINSINGVTQLITQLDKHTTIDQITLKKYASILDTCNEDMLHLVNDVLDVHKIESGKFELFIQDYNLGNTITNICMKYNPIIAKKQLQFIKHIDPKLNALHIKMDRARIVQVLENLLQNAIKYTDEGSITLSVNIIESNATHAKIEFKVIDTGIGIKTSNFDYIFESFKQIKNNDTDIYGGAGLGLSISKTILSKMNSSINLKSQFGEGSNFSFVVDFKISNLNATIIQTKSINSLSSTIKHKTVLIAEDNNVSLLYTSTLLRKLGATVFETSNGYEAIETIQKHTTIDTVLLDLDMPECDGYEAIKTMRVINPNCSIIAFTATKPDREFTKELMALGFDNYVAKPFKKEELLTAINSASKQKQASI